MHVHACIDIVERRLTIYMYNACNCACAGLVLICIASRVDECLEFEKMLLEMVDIVYCEHLEHAACSN